MRFAGWYGVVVGGLMLAQWAFFLITGNVPELQSEPLRIAFHLAAELLTAAALIVAGAGLLRARSRTGTGGWARTLYLLAAGMVIYSEIVSPGYFAQQGQWFMVGMFAVVLGLAIASVVCLVRDDT